ncbi:MAG: hypothetical protein Q7U85_09475, partial [Rhodocyclaceae bacterium]|nr:hypothetical protein [Rhodocyclaceae bacterium]
MKPTSAMGREVIGSAANGWVRLLGYYRGVLMVLYLVAALFFLALGTYEWQRIGENTDAMLKLCHQIGAACGDDASAASPAEKILAIRDQSRKSLLLIVLASFIVTSALLHLMVNRARRHYLSLQLLASLQEGIIAERTRELKESNAGLNREVLERRQREDELRVAGAV